MMPTEPFVAEIDHREINKFSLVWKNKHANIVTGTFGTVYKAVWKNYDVAVKYIAESFPVTQISHPNIVKLYGRCIQKPNVCLVMEFCDGVSIYDLLYSEPQIQYTLGHAISWMKQCAEAFHFLHSLKSRPWNLNMQNLFLVNDGTVLKIQEIYMTTEANWHTDTAIDDEPNQYMAPEIIKRRKYTKKCDVYSWGSLLQVLLNRLPSVDLNCQWIFETLDPNPSNRPKMHKVAKKMTDLCKSYPGGDKPLVIPAPSAEGNILSHLERNDAFNRAYKTPWHDQYIGGKCIEQEQNPLEFRSLTWLLPNKQRQISSVPIIDRTGYVPENFEEFIHFLNTDNCEITDDNGIELLKLAIKFKVVKLEQEVINRLSSMTWILKLFEFSVTENYQMVRRHCNEFIAPNYALCLKNEYFVSLHPKAVKELLNFDHIEHGVPEVDIFIAFTNWKHSYYQKQISALEERKHVDVDGILKNIRFGTMELKDFKRCLNIFPNLLNENVEWNVNRRNYYEFPNAWRNVEFPNIRLQRKETPYHEQFKTILQVTSSDVILCGLRVGIGNGRKNFKIRIIKKCVSTSEIEQLVIMQNAYKYWDYVIIVLGDSVVLKPKFEYEICIEYLRKTDLCHGDYRDGLTWCMSRKVLPVAINSEFTNSVSVSSSDNMLEMMFANPQI